MLDVDQRIAALAKMVYQMGQSDLRGVADAEKLRLGGEQSSDRHAVDTAGKLVLMPYLDAVRVPQLVQLGVGVNHFRRKPSLSAPAGSHRAALYDTGEIAVSGHLELTATASPPQTARDVKPLVFDDRPRIGRPPGQRGLEVGYRPGKYPMPIGVQQPFGRKFAAETDQTLAISLFGRWEKL